MKVSFHVSASRELDEAADWYEQQRSGLGLQFVEAVQEAIEYVVANPLSGGRIDSKASDLQVRRYVLRQFPYKLYYRVFPDHIRVLAVAHGSRRPAYWRNRQ